MPRKYVAVCGASEATAAQLAYAREVRRLWSVKGLETASTPSAAVKRALR
jgi:hypothetical protein